RLPLPANWHSQTQSSRRTIAPDRRGGERCLPLFDMPNLDCEMVGAHAGGGGWAEGTSRAGAQAQGAPPSTTNPMSLYDLLSCCLQQTRAPATTWAPMT